MTLYLLASNPDSFFFLQISLVQIRTRHCLVHFNVIPKQPNFSPGKSFLTAWLTRQRFESQVANFCTHHSVIYFFPRINHNSSAAKRRHCLAMLDSLHGWFSGSHPSSDLVCSQKLAGRYAERLSEVLPLPHSYSQWAIGSSEILRPSKLPEFSLPELALTSRVFNI